MRSSITFGKHVLGLETKYMTNKGNDTTQNSGNIYRSSVDAYVLISDNFLHQLSDHQFLKKLLFGEVT
jgi:hypothetical protein